MKLPQSDWKTYPGCRKIERFDGFVVIVPEDYQPDNVMPLFCDVCQIRFTSKDDENSYKTFKCCSACADTWAYSNKKVWEEGWRPSQEQIENSVQKRLIVSTHIHFD
jgi:hypothetical protein